MPVFKVENVFGKNHSTEKTDTLEPISIVYFTGPKDDTLIKVLDSPKITGEINPKYKQEITAGEHLWNKINASNK